MHGGGWNKFFDLFMCLSGIMVNWSLSRNADQFDPWRSARSWRHYSRHFLEESWLAWLANNYHVHPFHQTYLKRLLIWKHRGRVEMLDGRISFTLSGWNRAKIFKYLYFNLLRDTLLALLIVHLSWESTDLVILHLGYVFLSTYIWVPSSIFVSPMTKESSIHIHIW